MAVKIKLRYLETSPAEYHLDALSLCLQVLTFQGYVSGAKYIGLKTRNVMKEKRSGADLFLKRPKHTNATFEINYQSYE